MAIKATIDEVRGIVSLCSETDYAAVHIDRLSPENKVYGLYHGIKQRVVDGAALPFNKEENRYPTEEEKFAAAKRIIEHLNSGSKEWDLRVAGEPKGGLLFAALRRAYPDKSADDIRAFIKARSKREQTALLRDPLIKPHVDAINAEEGKGVDTSALLAGL